MKVLSTALLLAITGFGLVTEPRIVNAQEGQGSGAGAQGEEREGRTRPSGRTAPSDRTRPPGAVDDTGPGGARPGNGVERPTVDVFGRSTRVRGSRIEDKLMGGWRLKELRLAGSSDVGRIAQGFLHVGNGILSLEVHAAWDPKSRTNSNAEPDMHTTFTAEYELGPAGTLDCTTILGSFMDDQTGELRWERAGFRREYKVTVEGIKLTLTFGHRDGQTGRMVFEPFFPSAKGGRDLFGRPLRAGAAGGAMDIFGRPTRASTSGERDMFGREKPVEGEEAEGPAGEGAPPEGGGSGSSGGSGN